MHPTNPLCRTRVEERRRRRGNGRSFQLLTVNGRSKPLNNPLRLQGALPGGRPTSSFSADQLLHSTHQTTSGNEKRIHTASQRQLAETDVEPWAASVTFCKSTESRVGTVTHGVRAVNGYGLQELCGRANAAKPITWRNSGLTSTGTASPAAGCATNAPRQTRTSAPPKW